MRVRAADASACGRLEVLQAGGWDSGARDGESGSEQADRLNSLIEC